MEKNDKKLVSKKWIIKKFIQRERENKKNKLNVTASDYSSIL